MTVMTVMTEGQGIAGEDRLRLSGDAMNRVSTISFASLLTAQRSFYLETHPSIPSQEGT